LAAGGPAAPGGGSRRQRLSRGKPEATGGGAFDDARGDELGRGGIPSQTLRAAPDGVEAIEMAADEDAEAGAGRPTGLLAQLQVEVADRQHVVPPHQAGVFFTEDLREVDVAHGHKGRGGTGRRASKGGVVVGDEDIAQIGVGPLERGEAGQAEFVDEAIVSADGRSPESASCRPGSVSKRTVTWLGRTVRFGRTKSRRIEIPPAYPLACSSQNSTTAFYTPSLNS